MVQIVYKYAFLRTYHLDFLKSKADVVAKVNTAQQVLGSSLQLQRGFMFSRHVWIKDSNKAEVLAILEALQLYSGTSLEE